MLEHARIYTRIYSIFPCRAGTEVLRARWASIQTTLLVLLIFEIVDIGFIISKLTIKGKVWIVHLPLF
jgi:hypothetical protein